MTADLKNILVPERRSTTRRQGCDRLLQSPHWNHRFSVHGSLRFSRSTFPMNVMCLQAYDADIREKETLAIHKARASQCTSFTPGRSREVMAMSATMLLWPRINVSRASADG